MGRRRDSLYEESELATEERSPNSPPKREFEESELPTEERIRHRREKNLRIIYYLF
jgi:hypothetical protein